jgi:hypothetical protein
MAQNIAAPSETDALLARGDSYGTLPRSNAAILGGETSDLIGSALDGATFHNRTEAGEGSYHCMRYI